MNRLPRLLCRMLVLALVLAAPPWLPWSADGARQRSDPPRPPAGTAAAPAAPIVPRLMRADYEGDRAALLRLREELAVPADDAARAARVHYWRGFARWRRAINGVNDNADTAELQADVDEAMRDFAKSIASDPRFQDANVGRLSCIQINALLARRAKNLALLKELLPTFNKLLEETVAAAPDNPRLLWVQGMQESFVIPGMSPEQINERQAKALAMYERGLRLVRAQQKEGADSLEPAWGEPELLVNIAWGHLSRSPSDVSGAEKYARDALAMVPHWRYVRQYLLPQIEQRAKSQAAAAAKPPA